MQHYTYIAHHGIKGQRWGERRYQNPDGSLTPEGVLRYQKKLNRMKSRQEYRDKSFMNTKKGRRVYSGVGAAIDTTLAVGGTVASGSLAAALAVNPVAVAAIVGTYAAVSYASIRLDTGVKHAIDNRINAHNRQRISEIEAALEEAKKKK